jgi:hypothetical protein
MGIALTTLLSTGNVLGVPPDPAPTVSTRSEESVTALALRWFTQMEAGQIDRSKLTSTYNAQLTDDAVLTMSKHLKEYGASPKAAEVLRSRTVGDQTLYLVKLLFPRGDAAALVLGLRSDGKITGVNMVSMAGD